MAAASRPGKHADLARLRAEVARLEGDPGADAAPVVPLGLAAIDTCLPGGGIGRGRVHEIATADGSAAAFGIALWFVSRLCAPARPFLWCVRALPYAPALADFGLHPDNLILARCRNSAELLWAAEEGLGAPALGAVLIEAATVSATAARRLALAARASGITTVLLRPGDTAAPLAAETRWRVAAAPENAWDIELVRARGVPPRRWRVVWRGVDTGARLTTDHDHDNGWKQSRADTRRSGTAGAGPVAAASAGGAG